MSSCGDQDGFDASSHYVQRSSAFWRYRSVSDNLMHMRAIAISVRHGYEWSVLAAGATRWLYDDGWHLRRQRSRVTG